MRQRTQHSILHQEKKKQSGKTRNFEKLTFYVIKSISILQIRQNIHNYTSKYHKNYKQH